MLKSQKKIGEILIEKKLISAQQLADALEEQKRTKEFLGKILLKRRFISDEALLNALSEQFGIPWMSLRNQYLDYVFMRQFSSSLILDSKCLPLKKEEFSVIVAISNPLDAWAILKAEEEVRPFKLKLVLVSPSDIEHCVEKYRQEVKADIKKTL